MLKVRVSLLTFVKLNMVSTGPFTLSLKAATAVPHVRTGLVKIVETKAIIAKRKIFRLVELRYQVILAPRFNYLWYFVTGIIT